MTQFDDIAKAVAVIAAGGMAVVLDDEDRENEGDLICSAQFCDEEQVNFLSRYACGLICTPLTAERAAELKLTDMVQNNTALHGTKFTVSIDYVHGTTTGISASDRSATIRALALPEVAPDDFGRPGHIFPLIAAEGGVLRRAGHTEQPIFGALVGIQDTEPAERAHQDEHAGAEEPQRRHHQGDDAEHPEVRAIGLELGAHARVNGVRPA